MARGRTAAIVGIGHTEYAKRIERDEVTLACEAVRDALLDAGLGPADVDGIVRFDMENTQDIELARNLGVPNLRFFASTPHGGGGGCPAVGIAAMAIEAGRADVVVVWRSRKRGSGGRPWAQNAGRIPGEKQWWLPYGLLRPVDQVALMGRRLLHERGYTQKHLGGVAVAFRAHAARNPGAIMGARPLDLDGYFDSRVVSDPLRVPDCCLETDGAAAVVLTSADRAEDLRQPAAHVRAAAQGSGPQSVGMANYFGPDITTSPAKPCGDELFRQADVTPTDIDCAQIYDAFTPLVLQSLEEYGLCDEGEAGELVEKGELNWPDGRLPCNTSGGSLSEAYLHGMNLVLEGVRQVRGTSTCQVEAARNVLVTSGNGVPTGAVVLSTDPRGS